MRGKKVYDSAKLDNEDSSLENIHVVVVDI